MDPDFEVIKELLTSDKWPEAVDPALMVDINSEEDKIARGEGILDAIVETNLGNLKVLDFGCGLGHMVNSATNEQNRAQIAVGYDPIEQEWEKWKDNPKTVFTTDWNKVIEHAPYDIIVAYDVLDHMLDPDQEIIANLKRIKAVLSKNGRLHVRCHPWCSRHSTHLYRKINKAYVHLILNDTELTEMGYTTEFPCRKIIHPIITYRDWFQAAGIRLIKEHVSRKKVEPFFQNGVIAKRIKANWSTSHKAELKSGKMFPAAQLEQEWIDYVLN